VYLQIFEFGMLLLFILCIVDAARKGRRRVIELIGASVAGLVLEVLAVIFLGLYWYSDSFVLAVMGAPVCIGLGWGIVVYLSMSITDNLGLDIRLRPLLDGIIALNVDLAMDVVAIRVDFWQWEFGSFFGVPYFNYLVWFLFVYACSATIRWSRTGGPEDFKEASIPQKVLMALVGAIDNLFRRSWKTVSILLLFWRGSASKELTTVSPGGFEPLTFIILSLIHIYFLVVLVANRWFGIPWLLVISIAMLLIGIVLHLLPLVHRFRQPLSVASPGTIIWNLFK